MHPELIEELRRLLSKSGDEDAFLALLANFLNIIASCTPNFYEITKVRGFEKLKNAKDLYSMRFCMKNKNIRILFSFYENNVLLLCAFHERQGKNVSEYEAFIPSAQTRFAEMTREED